MTKLDSGWSWVVLGGSFFVSMLLHGIPKSSGLLYNELTRVYNVERSTAASVTSVEGCIRSFIGPIAGALCHYFSCRQIVIIAGLIAFAGQIVCTFAPSLPVFLVGYGCIYGIGTGLAGVPARLIVTQYFEKKRTFAVGLSMSGSCVGGAIMPLLMQFFLENYGLHGAATILASIVLNLCVCGMTFAPPKMSNSTSTAAQKIQTLSAAVVKDKNSNIQQVPKYDKEKKTSRFAILKNGRLILILTSAMAPVMCMFGFLISMPEYAMTETGEPVTSTMASLLLSCLSISDFVGRLTITLVSSKNYIPLNYSYIFTILLPSAVYLILPMVSTYYGLLACSIVFGFAIGAGIITPTFLVNYYLPQDQWPTAYGLVSMIAGFPMLGTGPLLGGLRELTGSYVLGYRILSILSFAAVLTWIVELIVQCKSGRKVYKLYHHSVHSPVTVI